VGELGEECMLRLGEPSAKSLESGRSRSQKGRYCDHNDWKFDAVRLSVPADLEGLSGGVGVFKTSGDWGWKVILGSC